MLRRKETEVEEERECAPFKLLSLRLPAANTCPGEGGSPHAGGQLDEHVRSGPQAGGGWRAAAGE